jgi:uncharacterized membrane protein
MKKKASLSLSVNAIVVLILAIVMLGLGLGFIRGMFGKVSTQVEQQVSAEPEPPIPTASNPITLSREMVITNAGNKEVMKVSVFNPANDPWTVKPEINCSTGEEGLEIKEQTANQRTIEQGEHVTFNLLITIPASAPNTYLCQMELSPSKEGYSKDMTIKIVQ